MNATVVDNGLVFAEETHLTVLKTSLFFANDGFTVYDCAGQLAFRVDSYGPDARDKAELVLMDARGRCLLTVRRKRPSLHQRWEGFLGERSEGQKPMFSVRRSSIIGRCGATVEVYSGGDGGCGGGREEYQIEGNFGDRSCSITDAKKAVVVAEVRRKVDATMNVTLGKEVFSLCLMPGFDAAFAMGLVLVLDQISGDDSPFDEGVHDEVDPGAQDKSLSY